jgi:penicillin-binding protein 1A
MQRGALNLKAVIITVLAVTLGVGSGLFLGHWMKKLPPVESLEFFKPNIVTRIYDSEDALIAELYTERRTALRREEIPESMLRAILAAEDEDFFSHTGLDFPGILRAALIDIKSMKISQGASTITQQLARMLFLTNERTFTRKLKEIILSVKIEQRYSKDEILMLYMNQNYFGHGAYGVESAAKTFFDKSVGELTIPQCAMIAGLLPNPAFYSPFRHPENALKARNKVLNRMVKCAYISVGDQEVFEKEPLNLVKRTEYGGIAPFFVEETRKKLVERLGNQRVLTGGLKVYTTLVRRHQDAADFAVEKGLKEYRDRHVNAENIQSAFISIRSGTGEITSMVGGDDFERTKFNRSVQAKRQSGSAIKPFVYLSALMKGHKPNDIIMDAPVVFEDPHTHKKYRPRNYDRKYHGATTLRVALEKSYNVVTAKLLEQIGVPSVLDTVKQAGIESELPPYLSMGLGSGEVSLMELVNAYATLASKGLRSKPYMIREIRDSNNKRLFQAENRIEETLDPRFCFQIVKILQGAVTHGSGWRAQRLNRPIAAKTGTTNDSADAWFVGFSPSLAAGAWVGFDLRQSLGKNETGSRAAGPIFTEFFAQILAGTTEEDFQCPHGLEEVVVCRESGCLATDMCPVTIHEFFLEGQKPIERCPVHQPQ